MALTEETIEKASRFSYGDKVGFMSDGEFYTGYIAGRRVDHKRNRVYWKVLVLDTKSMWTVGNDILGAAY